jgi:myo-inositol-1(or 4)-monophosphatase
MNTPSENILNSFEALLEEVREAGTLVREYFTSESMANEQKADGSVVTEIDTAVEAKLVAFVRREFPNDSIVAEEGSSHVGTSEYVWHIDPIDGTDNFFRRIPFTAISVARLGPTTEDSFGVVYNPITEQLFSSVMEGGVYENTRIHKLHNQIEGGRSIISLCRGKEPWMRSATYNLQKEFGTTLGKGAAYGCCALEIAYIAANRIDGVLTFGLNSYDYAAGLYLVRSAGGVISVFSDGKWQRWNDSLQLLCKEHGKTLFVSHEGIHDTVLAKVGDPRQWAD